MKENIQKLLQNKNLWKKVLQIAAIFTFLISILLIFNYIQSTRVNPAHLESINKLVVRLSDNPQDAELRDEIRNLDLIARKAYFTTQWQLRTGAYLLLISMALFIISVQIIQNLKTTDDIEPGAGESDSYIVQKLSQKWIIYAAIGLAVMALLGATVNHQDLGKRFVEYTYDAQQQEIAENPAQQEQTYNQPVIEVIGLESRADSLETIQETDTESDNKADTATQDTSNTETKLEPENQSEKTETIYSEKDFRNNYPAFRGYGSYGVSYQSNIPKTWNTETGENIAWKVKIPLPGYNSPIVWGNYVFISGATAQKRQIFAYNRISGALLWAVEAKNIPGSPATAPKVTEDTGHAAPTLATDGNRVYGLFANGDLLAVDFSGKIAWSRNPGVPDNHYAHSSSLLVYKNMLILQYDHHKETKVMGLNTQNGETVWETKRNVKISWASPSLIQVNGQAQVVLAADPLAVAYDPLTGKELWKQECLSGEVGPSIAFDNNIVFAVNEYAALVAFSVNGTPKVLWEDTELLSDVASPVAVNGLLFIATSYGVLACYDAKDGTKYWEQDFDDGFYASPVVNNNVLFATDLSGNIYQIKVQKDYELISESQLGEATFASPAFANGMLYMRGENHLFGIKNTKE